MKLRIGICIIVSLFCVGALPAAELEPALESELTNAPSTQSFSVIVKLHNPRDIQALDQELHARRASHADRHRIVMHAIHSNAEETQGPVIARLERMLAQGQIEGYRAYWIENLIVVAGNAEAVLGLATDPAVESIGFNFKAELIEPVMRGPIRGRGAEHLDNELVLVGQRATGATRVNRELGITGHGVIVANCDTGVDLAHPALHNRWRGLTHPHSECWLDLLSTSDTPSDGGGHGTHTMGTMAGRAINGNDTITVGAAPDAEWIATNPINQGVSPAFIQDILDAYEWLADPDGDSTTVEDVPDVVQNSWGVTTGHVGVHCYSNWNTALLNCEAAGVVVTWSAGNEGSAAQSLRSPATYELNATQMFSVGAVDLSSDSIAPYPIAYFSSRGPSGCPPNTNAIKPEICAPGVHVYSSYPGNQYQYMDGTSMAGPHVAGIVALMREACPNCDPQTIKETLLSTAIDSGYAPVGDDNTFGHGFIDGYAAVMAVSSLGRVDGYVTMSDGSPLPGARVQAIGAPNYTLTGTSGYYNLVAPEGTYSIRYSKFGYQTVQRDSVQTFQGDTTHVNVTLAAAPAGVLAGTVLLQSGVPIQGALVTFPGNPVDTLITDVNGQFVQALPATSYNVHIRFTINLTPPRVINADTIVVVNAGDTTYATLIITVDLVEPSSADAYGYRAYDRYDRDLPCPYDWLELDPGLGGNGVEFTYVHHDSANFFPVPFPIEFYGNTDSMLTVNCNGWMLPGVHHEAGAMDYVIPSTLDPPGIIAPFWNDLRRGNGAQQFTYYDELTGRWVFEFENQRLVAPANYLNNWQVQLIDPAFTPTATGDCEIHFVYGVLQYPSACTVGIENSNGTVGVQVQHDTSLSSWSWPVEQGAAIRFTTGRATQHGTATMNLSLYPPPQTGDTVTVLIGGRSASRAYPTQVVADSVPAAPVSAIVTTTGYERTRIDHHVIIANQNNAVAMESWRLDPPDQVSGGQMNGAVTLHWRRPQSVTFHAYPAALHYNVYRDGNELAAALTDTFFTDQALPNDSTVSYVVEAVYRHNTVAAAPYSITIDLAVKRIESTLPTVYQLYPNYPNPFNPDTRIRLDVPVASTGRLEVYDLQGRLVRTLWSGTLTAGRYQYSWNSRDERGLSVSSGLYFCRFSSRAYTATQKMMLIK